MKSFQSALLSLAILILVSFQSSAQWVRQYPLDKLENVVDMDVSDDGYGFAVGPNDLLLRLSALDQTWELLPDLTLNWQFESVDYLEGSNGNVAAAGGNGLLLTTDKGENWSEIAGAPAGIHTVRMFSPTHLIAIGDEGAFIWQNDQWTDLLLPAVSGVKGAFILDEQHMWVFTTAVNSAIYYTTDGGDNWNINLDINDIDVVRFYDAQNGIATDGRDVYHSTNGGMTWVLTGNNALPNTVNDLDYGSTINVLLGATLNAEPALSLDTGKTWMSLDPGFINQRSYSVVALSDTEFWMGNDLTSIIHSTDGGMIWTETSGPERNVIQDIHFLTRSAGFAIGQQGMLLRTMDGGTNWEDISFGTRSHLAIHGIALNDLWIGTNQRILHSVDTGSTWTDALVILGGNINDVLALSADIIFGVSSSGIIYRSTDGGMDWDTMYNAGTQLKSIARINSQQLMATGFNGVILRSDDAGLNWAPLTPPEAGLQYEQVYFLDTSGWLVTSSFKKTMWKTTDAGESWTPITLPIERFWDGVYFISQDTGIVVGRSSTEGRAYITFNGGQNWSAGHVLSFPLFGVAGVPNPNGTAWIYGYGSDIEVLPYCNTFPAIADFKGELFPCEGDTVIYSVSSENVDVFSWHFPTGWEILGNANNDTVTVKVGSNSGILTVSGSNACGESGQLNFSAGPILQPEVFSITGNPFPCIGHIVEYSVFENNAEVFSWTIPSDWGIIGNADQSTIMVQVGSSSGMITVQGSNSCGTSSLVDYEVMVQPGAQISLTATDLTPCPGDTITLSYTCDLTYTYIFLPPSGLSDWTIFNPTIPCEIQMIAGQESGTFQIIAENECAASAPAEISFTPENVPQIDISFNEGTAVLSTTVTGTQYQWYFNGGIISGANDATHIATQNGSYHVVVTFANGCQGASSVFNVMTVATEDIKSNSLYIYPNPVIERMYVSGANSTDMKYSITDPLGKIVDNGIVLNNMISVNELHPGYYFVKIVEGGKTYVFAFVKA